MLYCMVLYFITLNRIALHKLCCVLPIFILSIPLHCIYFTAQYFTAQYLVILYFLNYIAHVAEKVTRQSSIDMLSCTGDMSLCRSICLRLPVSVTVLLHICSGQGRVFFLESNGLGDVLA